MPLFNEYIKCDFKTMCMLACAGGLFILYLTYKLNNPGDNLARLNKSDKKIYSIIAKILRILWILSFVVGITIGIISSLSFINILSMGVWYTVYYTFGLLALFLIVGFFAFFAGPM